MGKLPTKTSTSLTDLPDDELRAYGQSLGLNVPADTPRGELLRRIRERQELLVELDRDALLDIVVWARVPVRRSASKEVLAKAIAGITRSRFDGLSERGLRALARLRSVSLSPGEPRESLERRLRWQGGLWARVHRKRREVVASFLERVIETRADASAYRFLPEDDAPPSLRDSIEDAGVVGGIAQRIRGAADHYVQEKLDEIERRIDAKLDEIDRRLGEWRDREIKNRLRIVRITLIAAIVVAAISLGYDYLKARTRTAVEQRNTPTRAVTPDATHAPSEGDALPSGMTRK